MILREKFLFISAEYDYNGALDPSKISTILSQLSNSFDLKFQVVKSNEEICEAIENGKQTGKLMHVLINGHGNPSKIALNKIQQNYVVSILETTDFSKCFSGIQPNGKVLLLSCSTGKERNNDPFNNIAQKMADDSKRTIVAPTNDAYPVYTNILSTDDGVLYHPENRLFSFLPFYNTNLFASFRPNFKKCFPEIDQNKIHPRELAAIAAIKSDLLAKSLLHKNEPVDKIEKYLQICKDDPRAKVLFFSAEYDKNRVLEPDRNSKILSVLADRFDLRYKVVKSLNEICQAIDEAAKLGKVITVLIQAYGTWTDGMILSKDSNNENRIKASDNFSHCFSGIEDDGSIVLMGGALGQNAADKDNIAEKISNDSKRTVLATTCLIYPSRTTIQSINPLMLMHPAYSSIMNLVYERCPENNKNHFKTFNKK